MLKPQNIALKPGGKIIKVNRFDGIPPEHQPELYNLMKHCSNGERLLVCLLFMSDLPERERNNSHVELELRKIFPPSMKHNLSTDQYKDFQATAVRMYWNMETRAIAAGDFSDDLRLWENTCRGHWRNTDLGNRYARQKLRQLGVWVERAGAALNPQDEQLPHIKRRYLENDSTQEGDDEAADGPTQPESMFAHVVSILSSLPRIEFDLLPEESGPQISINGSPEEVLGVIRSVGESIPANEIQLVIKMDSRGYRVEVSAACVEVHKNDTRG